jgi:hypothetical protein
LYDVLQRHGEKMYSNLATCIRWIWAIQKPTDDTYAICKGMRTQEGLELLEKYPHVRDSVALLANTPIKSLTSIGLTSALHFLCSKKDKAAADAFWLAVATGENLSKSNPAYVLRERLINNRRDVRKIGQIDVAAICIKAWNCSRDGKRCGTLKWSKKEEFPKVK